jgi:predicted anti-sigma-YlaC factor YlaD
MNCREARRNLPTLVLDADSASSAAREHFASCSGCASEFKSMKATISLLDEWAAPNPSSFFDTRLYARLRSEQASAPPGFLERIHAWFLYRAQYQARRWTVLALALLTIGGGSVAWLESNQKPSEASVTVQDLEWYDGNAQMLQQLNSFDAEDQSSSVEAR